MRILYSTRAIWRPDVGGDAHQFCIHLAEGSRPLTAADGVDHPLQLLLAVASADVPAGLLEPRAGGGSEPVLALLNEVCARHARGELQAAVGNEEPAISAASRRKVANFLSVSEASAPRARAVDEAEPPQQEVRDGCCADWVLDSDAFDFVEWVGVVLRPWIGALVFVQRLRTVLLQREGGWPRLARDMEHGRGAWSDVAGALQRPVSHEEGSLAQWLGVDTKNLKRVCAAVAAQAFLHSSSQLRRPITLGGSLTSATLADVREAATLGSMAVDLRMAVYRERVGEKMKEWHRVGMDMTVTKARACDIGQYSSLCGSHTHGLNKETFWGLWRAAKADGANGEKVKEFLRRCNQGFQSKHG